MKTIKTLTLAALAATLLFQTPITLAGGDGKKESDAKKNDYGPQRITFEKCWGVADEPFGGHFEGTVAGDCGTGTVAFKYLSVLEDPPFVRFAGVYTITTADCTFKTVCGGSVDTRNGRIVLNGVVTDGSTLGDPVRLRAQLNDAGNCSAGTMTITPIKRK